MNEAPMKEEVLPKNSMMATASRSPEIVDDISVKGEWVFEAFCQQRRDKMSLAVF